MATPVIKFVDGTAEVTLNGGVNTFISNVDELVCVA